MIRLEKKEEHLEKIASFTSLILQISQDLQCNQNDIFKQTIQKR